ncbi:helix-turn-helix domain-containing protein [Streptomyces sp. NBC_01102]|nr:helix-turn-helix domain-containing protein [Streptomyces sp. NBC_01102]
MRRAADLHQRELAEAIGLGSHVPVAGWESGKSFPPAEKMPAIAQALGRDIDDLFPRDGDPDLIDLRCDAGYSQGKAAELLAVVSRFQLGAAERGTRRLDEAALPALADLYGVPVEGLVAAQARSFGEVVSPGVASPASWTLAGTLGDLIDGAFPDEKRTAVDVAAAINAKIGTEVVTPPQVAALLGGASAAEIFSDGARTVVFEALGQYFGVSPMVFHDGQSADRRVLEDIRHLAARHDVTLAARGGEGGISQAFLAVLNDLLASDDTRA